MELKSKKQAKRLVLKNEKHLKITGLSRFGIIIIVANVSISVQSIEPSVQLSIKCMH